MGGGPWGWERPQGPFCTGRTGVSPVPWTVHVRPMQRTRRPLSQCAVLLAAAARRDASPHHQALGTNWATRPFQVRPIKKTRSCSELDEDWWPRPGSNRRHTDFQSVALPTELPSHGRSQGLNGRSAGIRTLDPVIKSHLLYQLSYAPIHLGFWSEERDSNPRQPPWQGGTLPTELSSHRENGE